MLIVHYHSANSVAYVTLRGVNEIIDDDLNMQRFGYAISAINGAVKILSYDSPSRFLCHVCEKPAEAESRND
jgi:hypothetical protein